MRLVQEVCIVRHRITIVISLWDTNVLQTKFSIDSALSDVRWCSVFTRRSGWCYCVSQSKEHNKNLHNYLCDGLPRASACILQIMGGEDSVGVPHRNHNQLNLALGRECAANNVFNDMCAENCAVQSSFWLHFREHVQPHQLCNEQNPNRAALEKPGRLHLLIRRNCRANDRERQRAKALALVLALAQWMWDLVSGSRATGPCTLAWPIQIFSGTTLLKFVVERKMP